MVCLSLEAVLTYIAIATYSLNRADLKCRQKTLPLMMTTAKKLHGCLGRVILLIFNLFRKIVDPDPHPDSDPQHFRNLDPDPHPHQGNRPDLDPHPDPHKIKIRIWIRITGKCRSGFA